MPLLHRLPFVPNEVPENIKPTDSVFYCEPTGEIFEKYEEFFERRVLLDTEVWSCSVTGKSNLTYDEAVESEEETRKALNKVDPIIAKVILHLFRKATGRVGIKNLAIEIHDSIKNLYFIGEIVNHQKKKYRVKSISSKAQTAQSKKDSDEENKSPEKISPPGSYEFSLESYDDPEVSKVLKASDITRKTPFNLPKLISFLIKINATQSETNKSWMIRQRAVKKMKLDSFEWDTVFPGPEPIFETKVPKEIKQKPRKKEPLGENKQNGKSSQKVVKKESEEDKKKREAAERVERGKLLRKAQQEWAKQKPDETLDDFRSFLLPPPKTIKTRIPEKFLGDVLQLIEFQKNFASAFGEMQFSDNLRKLTLEDIEEVFYSKSTSGTFCDMLFFYVQALRYCNENEKNEANVSSGTFPFDISYRAALSGEQKETENGHNSDNEDCEETPEANIETDSMVDNKTGDADNTIDEVSFAEDEAWPTGSSFIAEDCVALSTKTVLWSVKALGRPILELQVDEATITEVLRMSILSMAADVIPAIHSYRKTYRGNWDNEEDPFILSLKDEKLVSVYKQLETKSVFDLDGESKIALLLFLTDSVLVQNDGRQVIDDAEEKMDTCRKQKLEGWKNEKQRGREYNTKLADLEAKVKEEGTNEPEEQTALPSLTRSRRGVIEPPKLTAKDELKEFVEENDQLRWAHEDMIQRLNEKHNKSELKIRSQLLGVDRFHRRYWILSGCPGILVEVPPKHLLPVMANDTPFDKFTIPKAVPRPRMADIKLNGDDSDDDNIPLAGLSKKVSDEKIQETTTGENGEDMEVDTKPEIIENMNWSLEPSLYEKEKWFVYESKQDISYLLSKFNERGEREKELKTRIEKYLGILTTNQGETIYDTTLNKFAFDVDAVESEEANRGHILQLRDYLLDIEERIFNADFGDAFEDENERLLWRTFWERAGQEDVIDIDFYDKVKDSLPPRIPLPIHMIPRKVPKEIRNLSASLLLMARALRRDIIARPMGMQSKVPKKKKAKGDSHWRNILAGQYKNWEQSLMTATSASAVYLHVVHLDECIIWDKSPENLRCSICKKKSDAGSMLICDDCEKAFHTYCHKPKVKRIPEGDWFCKNCVMKHRQASSPVKKRRRVVEDEDEQIDGVFISDRPRKRAKVNYAE